MITMGIDVGSIFTKAILVENDRVLAAASCETGGRIADQAEQLIRQTLARGNIAPEKLERITATGQGDELIAQADYLEDDVACLAYGSRRLLPETELIIEIGAQSCTCIMSDREGNVVYFIRNDKCASGTGRFIEVIGTALGIALENFDEVVKSAEKAVTVSTQCAVFAESEIISYVNRGEAPSAIMAGVCESAAKIIVSQALRCGAVQHYTVSGGVAVFKSMIEILNKKLPGKYCQFPLEPVYAAAYGAALLGQQD